jgi:glycosyltransferase involved in cell wall biosynthesis
MRIAQVAPLFESVPPKNYGGTEAVVSYLTEELIRQGHQVTLFASGDSVTRAELIAPCERSLRLYGQRMDAIAYHFMMLEQVYRMSNRFDIIHFHVDYLHYPFSRRERRLHVTTLHGRLDLPELPCLYHEYRDMPVISISNFQRRPLPWLNWQGTVYHGLPDHVCLPSDTPGQYLAFLGRTSPEKGLDRAIEIACRVGMKLKIAAKVDEADKKYFEQHIRPLLNNPLIEFLGEVGGRQKCDFLRNAFALLFPIDWPEPFGLVMIEAMASGTPVIAWRNGSVPEVMVHGVSGFIVQTIEEAVQAARQVPRLDRRACRRLFEERYSARRMTGDYLQIYQQLIGQETAKKTGPNVTQRRRRIRQESAPELQSATRNGSAVSGGVQNPSVVSVRSL